MTIYRPRMRAELLVPTMGRAAAMNVDEATPAATTTVPLRIKRAAWEQNDHLTADTLELTVDWADAGIDPRILASAEVSFWLDDTPGGVLYPAQDNFRFVGPLIDISRDLSDSGRTVSLKAHDYTEFFIACKNFADKGVPSYSMSLRQAWASICAYCGYNDVNTGKIKSSVDSLSTRIMGRGKVNLDAPLSASISQRFSGIGAKFVPKKDATAWDVWQQVVGSVGYISFVQRDAVVVTDSAEYYTEHAGAPRMIWGRNILTMKEKRHSKLRNKRLALTAHDTLSHKVIEAFYPKRKEAVKAAKKPVAGGLVPLTEYDFFQYNYGVHDQAALDAIAQSCWEEMARQELEGTVTTREMEIDTADSGMRDLLTLAAGQTIRVEFEDDVRGIARAIGSNEESMRYLMSHGYQRETAQLMIDHMKDFDAGPAEFTVRKVLTTLSHDEHAGSFEFSIDYCNRIQPMVQIQ